MNDKNKIEALLFSSGRQMTLEEIKNLADIKDIQNVKNALAELKADYESRGGSVHLIEEGNKWKLNIKNHYQSIIQKIVSQTELEKPLMETLAVIAWKYPILQADVIRIRHNKAYDHLRVLEEQGFISRSRFGRTRKITLTQKFFEYFDLPNKETKDALREVISEDIKEKVEKTEQEIIQGEKRLEDINKKKEEIRNAKKKADKGEEKKASTSNEQKESRQNENHGNSSKNKTESTEEIKKEIEEEQKQEDEEIEKIEEDVKNLEQEEKKEFYE